MATITREKKMVEDIEVPVGSFWKSKSGVVKYAVLNDTHAMQVTGNGWVVFKMKGSWFLDEYEENQSSTREEFFSALKEAERNRLKLTANL